MTTIKNAILDRLAKDLEKAKRRHATAGETIKLLEQQIIKIKNSKELDA